MNAINRRIRRLQLRLCPDKGEQRLWVLTGPGYGVALDQDRCIQILAECGFLPKTRFGVLSFCGIPDGLNAKELENYLRINGTQTRGFASYQGSDGSEGALQLRHTNRSNDAQMSAGVIR
jgi:hypothetical protein